MYERFTDRARKVIELANQEAQRFNHEYVGTEHLLLGLVREGSGIAALVLKNLDVDLRKIRLEVEKLVQSAPDMVTMGKLPQTPRAKKVLEFAMEEARNQNHPNVGTEHLLLGLLREQEGVAAQVLMNVGLKLEEVREEVLTVLSRPGDGRSRSENRNTGVVPTPTTEPHSGRFQQPLRRHMAGQRFANTWTTTNRLGALLVAWAFVALGIAVLAVGFGRDPNLLLPGALLAAAGLISIALMSR